MLAQRWAATIRSGASDNQVELVIRAVNELTTARRANRAAVIVACAQILAQNIAESGPGLASDIRSGIGALVEGFAMQSALLDE
jgi:hypothetical protein